MLLHQPPGVLEGSTEGPTEQRQHRELMEYNFGCPLCASFTPSHSQPCPIAVSSLLAHLPLDAVKPFLWISRSLLLQIIFKRAFSQVSVNKCGNRLTEMCKPCFMKDVC